MTINLASSEVFVFYKTASVITIAYLQAGLFVDNIEQDDLTVKGYNKYDPRETPTDKKSDRVSAVFNRLTGIDFIQLVSIKNYC